MLFPAVLCGVTVIPHKMPRKKGLIGWVPASGIIIDFFLYNFIHSQNYLQEDTFLKKPRKPQGTLPNPEQHMSGPQVGGVGAAQAVLLGPDARYRTSVVTRPPRPHGSPGPSHPRCRQMAKASPAPPHSGPLRHLLACGLRCPPCHSPSPEVARVLFTATQKSPSLMCHDNFRTFKNI